jgi:alpha-D-xyloside xylohydrolase
MGPVTQYVDEKPDAPLTINVYRGANGRYSLYEDDGVSNAYQQGRYTRIPFAYDDASGELTIGERLGGYDGMVARRQFNIRFLGAGDKTMDFDAATVPVTFTGAAVTVKRP